MRLERLERLKADTTESPLFQGEHWTLPADIRLIGLAEIVFTRRLRKAGWRRNLGEGEFYKLKLAFREALINAIVHGNKENPDKKVDVMLEINEDRIFIKIRDEGDGFKPEEVPNPIATRENILKPSGRGYIS